MAKKKGSNTKASAAKSPEITGEKLEKKPGTFKPGAEWTGNKAGRPPGSRNKLCKRFIEDLSEVWHEANDTGKGKGIAAIRAIAADQPAKFVSVVSDLVPKEFDLGDRTTATFAQLWKAFGTGKVPKIEIEGDTDD